MDDYFEKINFHLRLLASELPMGLSQVVVSLNLSERSTDDLLNIFQEIKMLDIVKRVYPILFLSGMATAVLFVFVEVV